MVRYMIRTQLRISRILQQILSQLSMQPPE